MSIADSSKKINPVRNREGSQRPSVSNGVKQFIESEKGKDILVVVIVILVGLASFELGRLSKNTSSGVKIEYPNQQANVASSTESSSFLQNTKTSIGKTFFASNRGRKYYPLGCEAGNNIKQENKIYFATKEDAEGAGYELSSSCR